MGCEFAYPAGAGFDRVRDRVYIVVMNCNTFSKITQYPLLDIPHINDYRKNACICTPSLSYTP
jgi:hypothetical protein